MIYGLHKVSHTRERRITALLLLVYAAIAFILFYNERSRENVAENNLQPATQASPRSLQHPS